MDFWDDPNFDFNSFAPGDPSFIEAIDWGSIPEESLASLLLNDPEFAQSLYGTLLAESGGNLANNPVFANNMLGWGDDPSYSTPPIVQEPGFMDQFTGVLQKIGGSAWEAFQKNPMGFLTAGLGAGLTAYGLFRGEDGTYKDIATGRQVQLTPQEQQLLDTLNQQIQAQSSISNQFNDIYKNVLADPSSRASIENMLKGSIGQLNLQQQGQNALTQSIYGASQGTLNNDTPMNRALNASYANSGKRDDIIGAYLDRVGSGYYPSADPNFVNQYMPMSRDYATKSIEAADQYSKQFADMSLAGIPGQAQRVAGMDAAASNFIAGANAGMPELDAYRMPANAGAGMMSQGQGLFGAGSSYLQGLTGVAAQDRARMDALFNKYQNDPTEGMLQQILVDLNDPSSKEQQIIDAYNDRVLGALNGEGELDPRLERQQADQLRDLKARALRTYGPGYETTTFYTNQLNDLLARQNEADFTNRRQILTTDNEQRLASIQTAQDNIYKITQALYQGRLTNAQAMAAYSNAYAQLLQAQTELGGTMANAGTNAFAAGTAASKAAADSAASLANAETSRIGTLGELGIGAWNAGTGAQNADTNYRGTMGGLATNAYNAATNRMGTWTSANNQTMNTLQGIENSILANVTGSTPSGLQTINALYPLAQAGGVTAGQNYGMMAGINPGTLASNTFSNLSQMTGQNVNQQLLAQQLAAQGQQSMLNSGGSLLGYGLGSYLRGRGLA